VTDPVIGIIGGSGLYEIDGLVDVSWRRVAGPRNGRRFNSFIGPVHF